MMKNWLHILPKKTTGIFFPVVGVCVVLYFSYYIIQGDRGFRTLLDYRAKITETRAQLDEIRQKRKKLEKRVSLLRPDSLDPDLLEERVRIVLNYAEKDEFAIITQNANFKSD